MTSIPMTPENRAFGSMAHENVEYLHALLTARPWGTGILFEEWYELDADDESRLAGTMPEWAQLSEYVFDE